MTSTGNTSAWKILLGGRRKKGLVRFGTTRVLTPVPRVGGEKKSKGTVW
jgi:hypothetical protein